MISEGYRKIYYTLVVIVGLSFAYIFATSLKNNPVVLQTGISGLLLVGLSLMIALPQTIAWLFYVRGWLDIKKYIARSKNSAEQEAFRYISQGLFMFLIITIASLFVSRMVDLDEARKDVWRIITNIVLYILPFFAYWIMYQGAKRLARLAARRVSIKERAVYVSVGLLAGLALGLIIFSDPYRQIVDPVTGRASFYLSDALIAATILAPVVAGWVLGGLSILYIRVFSRTVKGMVDSSAIHQLAIGLQLVIIASIFVAMISTASLRLASIGTHVLIAVTYTSVFINIVGYLLISRGATRLGRSHNISGI